MVFDEALFSITVDRILPVVAFRSRMRSILMRVACKNRVIAWTAAFSHLFIASENLL
jgi:hypothetical protein